MKWQKSHRADPRACAMADAHYSRQKIGSPQFMPPGSCVCFYGGTPGGAEAVWGTSFPKAEYVKHDWAGAWMCSIFRNHGYAPASELILDAVAATRAHYGEPPPLGMVTFVDCKKVQPIRRRGVEVWGYTWLLAGFKVVGWTKGGLLAFQLDPRDMPPAKSALDALPEPA